MRIFILSTAALILLSLSPCIKENISVSGPTLQEELLSKDPLGDMDQAFQEAMEELEPLKKLSNKEHEAFKNSTNLPAYLAKLGVDVEAFQRHAQRFSAAIQQACNLDESNEVLVASIKKRSEPFIRQNLSSVPGGGERQKHSVL